MKHIIKRKNELIKSKWSGGSTTELFIFPAGASYQNRDFEIRVSSATVEQSPSVFTKLDSYQRLLMPLNAPLRLVFDGQDEINLKPFETAAFDGGIKTISYGLCTDIGIMFSSRLSARLFSADRAFKFYKGFVCVYALCDNVIVNADKEEHILMDGDFLILDMETENEITFILPDKNTAIIACITKK